MKKCTWCGKEYPNDVLVCAVDGQPLASDDPPPKQRESPDTSPSDASTHKSSPDPSSVLPWARKEQFGAFSAAWQTVAGGIVSPSRVLRIVESDPDGPSFFFHAFGFFCCAPVCAISLLLIIIHSASPDSLHFQDLNPYTVLIAVPAQFLVGPLALWVFSFAVALGSGSVKSKTKELKMKTGWYIGTFLWILGYWWLGLGCALSTVRFLRGIDRDETYLLFMMLAAAGLWVRVAVTCLKWSLGVSYGSAFLRLFLSIGAFVIMSIPIGFILSLFLHAII